MRVVIDTNLWVSGLLWRGSPGRLLRLAQAGQIELCLTSAMLSELAELLTYASSLVTLFEDADGMPIVQSDPDDDVFLHCAERVGAACVVSGDRHLLSLKQHAGIPILTVHDFLVCEFPPA